MARVSIVRCQNYQYEKVYSAIEKCLLHLGIINDIFQPGQSILVKVNNIGAYPPEKAATTHPAVVEAVIDLIRRHKAIPIVCDGPLAEPQKRPFSVSGIEDVCNKRGVELINFNAPKVEYAELQVKNGMKLKSLLLPKAIIDASAIINLPKLKTHEFTVFTGAVKNLFGLPPTASRKSWHRHFHYEYEFSKILVDILGALKHKLKLSIMDAVIAMEGNGPVAGNPRNIGLLMASRDPVALDAVSVDILGFDALEVSSTYIAHQLELGVGDVKQIKIIGENPEQIRTYDFMFPKVSRNLAKNILHKAIMPFITVRPKIKEWDCAGCKACYKNCPMGAISMVNSTAVINAKLCIKCYCCQESCIYGAVSSQGFFLKSHFLYEFLRRSKGCIYSLIK